MAGAKKFKVIEYEIYELVVKWFEKKKINFILCCSLKVRIYLKIIQVNTVMKKYDKIIIQFRLAS